MELIPTAHDSGKGIHARSKPATFSQARKIGPEIATWLAAQNGKFTGEHKSAFAIAHCQVCGDENPLNLFAVAPEMVGNGTGRTNTVNFYFPSAVIFNAVLLKAPDQITVWTPHRVKDKESQGIATYRLTSLKMKANNKKWLEGGCMSYPAKKSRKMERYFRIRVRYWFLWHGIPLRRTEWVEGLKAHIFQHEFDHFNAYPIYHRDKAKV